MKAVTIKGNTISNCGSMPKSAKLSYVGGFIFDGMTGLSIENNEIIGCRGYGIAFADYLTNLKGKSGTVATITGNTITGTLPALYPAPGSGSAIFVVDKRGMITARGNKMSGNKANLTGLSGS